MKKELRPYENEVERYVNNCSVEDSEKNKIKSAVAEMAGILQRNGHTYPEESDIEEYRIQRKDKDKSKDYQSTGENISRISSFFDWLRKENTPMTGTQESHKETLTIFPEEEAQPEEEAPKSNAGRKPISENGERKSEKFMLYLTPELIGEIRDWCYLKRISTVSYITGLIEADLHSTEKQEKLAVFRKLSDEA